MTKSKLTINELNAIRKQLSKSFNIIVYSADNSSIALLTRLIKLNSIEKEKWYSWLREEVSGGKSVQEVFDELVYSWDAKRIEQYKTTTQQTVINEYSGDVTLHSAVNKAIQMNDLLDL